MYTSVLFDLDGTLTDPREGILNSVRYALTKEGFDAPPITSLEWVIGPPLRGSFAQLSNLSIDDPMIEQLMTQYRERFAPIGLFENKVFPDIPELLKSLQNHRIKIFMATSKPTVYAEEIARHFELDVFFTDIIGSELDGSRENKAEIIAEVLQRHTLTADHCLMVGDRKFDIIGAKENGLNSVGVMYGFASRAELTEAGATYIVDSPLEILRICDILEP